MEYGKKRRLRVSFNCPAVLIFAGICLAARLIDMLTSGAANDAVFSVYRSSLASPMTYIRCVTHVFGHVDWDHLLSNMMYLLILGPMLEEKYGTRNIVLVMLVTAVITGVLNMVFFPHIALLGASGIVFAMILLSSITATRGDSIPVSFILVAVLYLGQQIYNGLFTADNISQLGHIAGGIIGSVLGFMLNRKRA